MNTTTIELGTLAPLPRHEAVALGRVEYQRLADLLAGLDEPEWARPTDCTLWTVRDLAGHVVGMMQTMHGLRRLVGEQIRVARRARRTGEDPVDAMTALQVEAVADLAPGELVERLRASIGGATRGRAGVPGPIARAVRFPQVVNGQTEKWTLDYLLGVIVTRDTWLHRVADVARAVDRPPALDPAHDTRIVADVVVEWCRRHGRPVDLTLTGPAGGRFRAGQGGPSIEADAVEFCRMLSGRAEPTHELLATQVPF